MRAQNPKLEKTEGRGGKWYIRPFVDTYDQQGNRVRKQIRLTLGYCSTMSRPEAMQERNKMLLKINSSSTILKSQILFGLVLDTYLRDHVDVPGILKFSTQERYRYQIRTMIRPAFADVPLGEMTTLRIQQWFNAQVRCAKSVRSTLKALLSSVFEKAIDWGMCETNPTQRVRLGSIGQDRTRGRVMLTDEQVGQILSRLRSDVRLAAEMALLYGLRIGEVTAIRWEDVDLAAGLIHVRQSNYRGVITSPKTEAGMRSVPIGALSEKLAFLNPGPGRESEYVVMPTCSRSSVSAYMRNDFLNPAAKEVGVYREGFGFHSLRREAITRIGSALPAQQVMRMVGHSSIAMTAHYTLADYEAQQEAQNKTVGKLIVN